MDFLSYKSMDFSWKRWLQSNHTAVWYIAQIWLSQSEFHVEVFVNLIVFQIENNQNLKTYAHLIINYYFNYFNF